MNTKGFLLFSLIAASAAALIVIGLSDSITKQTTYLVAHERTAGRVPSLYPPAQRRQTNRTVVCESAVYVDGTNGNDARDGLSWATAVKTIQRGIAITCGGMTVLVANGTYTGIGNKNLDFGGKAIHLRSDTGTANCVIDCENCGRGFYFHSNETEESIVDGFTIRNGNAADADGSAISCHESSPTIINCVITDNTANDGGGISCYDSSSPTITNCLIAGNTATSNGGGICCFNNSNPTINNCTITTNLANKGGGIYCQRDSGPTLNNAILWGNSASEGYQIYTYDAASAVTLNYCDYANDANDIAGLRTVTRNNCLSLDPLFVNALSGDYSLRSSSPCVDAGSDDFVYYCDRDLSGRLRLVDGDNDASIIVDIGAYEYQEVYQEPCKGLIYLPHTVTPNYLLPGSKCEYFRAKVKNLTFEQIVLSEQTLFRFSDGSISFEANLDGEVIIDSGGIAELGFAEAGVDPGLTPGSYFPVIEATDGLNTYEIPVSDTVTLTELVLTLGTDKSPYILRGACDFGYLTIDANVTVRTEYGLLNALSLDSYGVVEGTEPDSEVDIRSPGAISLHSGAIMRGGWVYLNASSLIIDEGALITADHLGLPPETGYGKGGSSANGGGGGGGYGGVGGYGVGDPGGIGGPKYSCGHLGTYKGSGGGNGGHSSAPGLSVRGGRGGGCIYIDAENITLNGTISANGEDGSSGPAGGGGGSAGAVVLICLVLEGSGSISLRGGNGGYATTGFHGGGGGGGWFEDCAYDDRFTGEFYRHGGAGGGGQR